MESIYVGGYFIIPFDPSIKIKNEDGEIEISLMNEAFPVIQKCLRNAIRRCLSYFYVFIPVSNNVWLVGKEHSIFLYKLYATASAAAFDNENPTMDIRILPVIISRDNKKPILIKSQTEIIRNLIRIDDPRENSFIERRVTNGPIACFACPPYLWSPPAYTGQDKINHNGTSNIPDNFKCAEYFSSMFLEEVMDATASQISKVVEFTMSDIFSTEKNSIEIKNNQIFEPLPKNGISVMGGTFDHLHPGHKFILSLTILLTQKKLVIGVSSDDAIQMKNKKKSTLVQPWILRCSRLIQYIQTACVLLRRTSGLIVPPELGSLTPIDNELMGHSVPISAPSFMYGNRMQDWWEEAKPASNIADVATDNNAVLSNKVVSLELEIVKIEDAVGPAGIRQDFESLILTPETINGGRLVNDIRIKNALNPLQQIVLPMIPISEQQLHPIVMSSKDTRLKDPTTASDTPSPSSNINDKNVELFDKTSSSHIRESIIELPTLQKLSCYWQKISSALSFPKLFVAAWGTRLQECFSTPWRELNRARLLLVMEKIWETTLLYSDEEPLSSQDKGWLSIVLWIALVSTASQSDFGVDLTLENVLGRSKSSELIQLFCSDLYISSWLCKHEERKEISNVWRAKGSRLTKIFPSEIILNDGSDLLSPERSNFIFSQPRKAVDNSEIKFSSNDSSVYRLQIQHNYLAATWRSSPEYLDLNNNLREACLYIVDAFVPKHMQSNYLGKSATAAALFISFRGCEKCSSSAGTPDKFIAAETAGGLMGLRTTNVSKRLELLTLIDQRSKDLLKGHTRILDLFVYLFFHNSHRTSIANTSIQRIISELDS